MNNEFMMALSDKFCDYIIAHHKQDLMEILKNPVESSSYSIIINFLTLFEEDINLGNGLLTEPEKYLLEFDKATIIAQECLIKELKSNEVEKFKVKSKVFVRITGLPVIGETLFPNNDDIGSFVKINGTLIKAGVPKILEYQRDYLCKKCHHVVTVSAKYERYYTITAPHKCEKCHNSNIAPKKGKNVSYFKDYQEIKVQEHFGKSKSGTVPHTIWVTLEDNLVDSCKPGDDVVVTGIVMRRWKPLKIDSKYDIDLVLKANNLEVCNEQKSVVSNEEVKEAFFNFWSHYKDQELFGRNHILKSFCPQVTGLYLVKLAMSVVLAGGVQKTDENGCSSRGMSHLLLVGDAGTGKSLLLRYASKISGRSVFTTGIGSTTAGLTVSAVRESGDWNLEAGALVLADGGICCIDDFSSIREHDRTSIHEAMEQQSISLAKAGIVTKLYTRCSIFATTSPKGKYDCSVPMSVNVAISSPLLSRFDIVLILLDTKSAEWDKSLCEFIFKGGKNSGTSRKPFPISNKKQTLICDMWSLKHLQNYFSVIKQINPVVTHDAGVVLRAYYQAQRMADFRNAARTTVRLLESLIRLSQGHARLMFRDRVTVLDAIVAISLIESSLQSATLMPEVNALHTIFPINPYSEYKSQVEVILMKLNLTDILNRELEKINAEAKLFDNKTSQKSNDAKDSSISRPKELPKTNKDETPKEKVCNISKGKNFNNSETKGNEEKGWKNVNSERRSRKRQSSEEVKREDTFGSLKPSSEEKVIDKKAENSSTSSACKMLRRFAFTAQESRSPKRIKLADEENDKSNLFSVTKEKDNNEEIKNRKKQNAFSWKQDENEEQRDRLENNDRFRNHFRRATLQIM